MWTPDQVEGKHLPGTLAALGAPGQAGG